MECQYSLKVYYWCKLQICIHVISIIKRDNIYWVTLMSQKLSISCFISSILTTLGSLCPWEQVRPWHWCPNFTVLALPLLVTTSFRSRLSGIVGEESMVFAITQQKSVSKGLEQNSNSLVHIIKWFKVQAQIWCEENLEPDSQIPSGFSFVH